MCEAVLLAWELVNEASSTAVEGLVQWGLFTNINRVRATTRPSGAGCRDEEGIATAVRAKVVAASDLSDTGRWPAPAAV